LTEFYEKGAKEFVFSLKNKINVSGKQRITTQVNKEGKLHGQVKEKLKDGDIYVGSV
jgi:hypothetical protein